MERKTRILPLEPPYPPDVSETLAKMMPPGEPPLRLFRTIAHHPRLLRRFSQLGGGVLTHSSLELPDRELVIHRTCARAGAEYEWGVHVARFGRPLGFSEEQIRATVLGDGESPVWSDRQRLLIRFTDELHETADVSDEIWTALEAHWDEAQRIELLLLAGFYRLVSYVVNATRVEKEKGAEVFPVI